MQLETHRISLAALQDQLSARKGQLETKLQMLNEKLGSLKAAREEQSQHLSKIQQQQDAMGKVEKELLDSNARHEKKTKELADERVNNVRMEMQCAETVKRIEEARGKLHADKEQVRSQVA